MGSNHYCRFLSFIGTVQARSALEIAMMMIAILGCTVGAILGLRFNAFVLIPAVLSVLFVAAVAGIAQGGNLSAIVLGMGVGAVAVQAGYLVAAAMLFAYRQLRERRGRGNSPEIDLNSHSRALIP